MKFLLLFEVLLLYFFHAPDQTPGLVWLVRPDVGHGLFHTDCRVGSELPKGASTQTAIKGKEAGANSRAVGNKFK